MRMAHKTAVSSASSRRCTATPLFAPRSGCGLRMLPVVRIATPVELSNGVPGVQDARVTQPITVNVPEPKPAVLPPPANYANVCAIGKAKAALPAGKVFVMGISAGVYIAFGAFLMLSIAGTMPGLAAGNPGLHKLLCAAVFPFGLLMVVMNAPELYTGNTAVSTCAYLEGQITTGDLIKNFFWSYAGNLVGSLLMVAAVVASGMLAGNMAPVNAAVAKTALPWGVAFIRAVLANYLVCMAVFHASAASSLPGKMMGLWPPITAFVAIGLEHSVANMFVIPMGIALGAKVSIMDFVVNNLIPVTLGNTFAGMVCVGLVYSTCFGNLGKKLFPVKTA